MKESKLHLVEYITPSRTNKTPRKIKIQNQLWAKRFKAFSRGSTSIGTHGRELGLMLSWQRAGLHMISARPGQMRWKGHMESGSKYL